MNTNYLTKNNSNKITNLKNNKNIITNTEKSTNINKTSINTKNINTKNINTTNINTTNKNNNSNDISFLLNFENIENANISTNKNKNKKGLLYFNNTEFKNSNINFLSYGKAIDFIQKNTGKSGNTFIPWLILIFLAFFVLIS